MLFNLESTARQFIRLSFAAGLAMTVLVATGCDGSGSADKELAANGALAGARSKTAMTKTAKTNTTQAKSIASDAQPEVNTTANSESTSRMHSQSALRAVTEPRMVSFEEAETAFQERRFDEGVRLFAAYTEQHSENPWGFYMLGLSAMKSGDSDLAETSYIRALELDSTHVKSWLNLSRTLLDLYRAEEALLAVEHAFEIEPGDSDVYRIKGRSLHAMGRYEDAADAYRDAIRINDTDVWAMNNLALILIEQERYELALPSLARATQLRDDIAVIYNNLGMALERTYRFRAAEEAYQTAVSIDSGHARASTNLARVKHVEQDSEIEPVDFKNLAQNFVDEIGSWSDEDIARELPLIQSQENQSTQDLSINEQNDDESGHR